MPEWAVPNLNADAVSGIILASDAPVVGSWGFGDDTLTRIGARLPLWLLLLFIIIDDAYVCAQKPGVASPFAKRTGAAASVERRRREPDRAISPE